VFFFGARFAGALAGCSGAGASWALLVAVGVVDVGASVVTPFVLGASCGGAGRTAFFLGPLIGLLGASVADAAWTPFAGRAALGTKEVLLVSPVLGSVCEGAGRGAFFLGAFFVLLGGWVEDTS
jgi:hypothetical protein